MSELFKPHQIGEVEKPHLPVIRLKTRNNEVVKPIPIEVDLRPVKGGELSPDPYANIFMIASTASGKTTALFHLLKKIVGKKTTIICFVSTIYNDKNWIEIVKYFEKKKIPIVTFMAVKEDGENHLHEIIEDLKKKAEERMREEAEEDGEEQLEPMEILHRLDGHKPPPKEKEKKEKPLPYQAPDYIIVFDDMAGETNNTYFANFLKKSRHFHAKVICLSQYCKDILPMGLLQIRQWLVFRGQDEDKLHHIYESMQTKLPEDLFTQMYHKATEVTKSCPKPFFFAYPDHKDYRICFSKEFDVPENLVQ